MRYPTPEEIAILMESSSTVADIKAGMEGMTSGLRDQGQGPFHIWQRAALLYGVGRNDEAERELARIPKSFRKTVTDYITAHITDDVKMPGRSTGTFSDSPGYKNFADGFAKLHAAIVQGERTGQTEKASEQIDQPSRSEFSISNYLKSIGLGAQQDPADKSQIIVKSKKGIGKIRILKNKLAFMREDGSVIGYCDMNKDAIENAVQRVFA